MITKELTARSLLQGINRSRDVLICLFIFLEFFEDQHLFGYGLKIEGMKLEKGAV
jgi:hypothetical protein